MSLFTIIFSIFFWICGIFVVLPLLLFLYLLMKYLFAKKIEKNTEDFESREVGVIIPFNGEWSLVDQAIRSIVDQSYEGEIKIYLAYNESLDAREIAQCLRLTVPKREVILVPSSSHEKWFKLNLCISQIQSEYIAILDTDHLADKNWIKDSCRSLFHFPSWVGVQCVRRPIIKNGIVYAWDSFINHHGNELSNRLKSILGFSVPFTGTTAVFIRKKIIDLPFEESLTEDTAWYLKQKFSRSDFYIGYQDESGSREMMSLTWGDLVKRRLRWVRGHNQAFLKYAQFSPPVTLAKTVDLIHGLHFFLVVPLIFSLGIYNAFFFLQIKLGAKILCVLIAFFFSWQTGRRKAFAETRLFMRFIAFMIPITMIISWSSQFKNIWWSQFISPYGLVAIPGSHLYTYTLYASLFISLVSFMFTEKRLIPLKYFFISLTAFPILVLTEVMASFVALRLGKQKKDNSWSTSRDADFYFDYIFFGILSLLILVQVIGVLDGRSPVKFYKDLANYSIRLVVPKKTLSFTTIKGIAVNGKPTEKLIKELAFTGARELRFYDDPGVEWIKIAAASGFKVVVQPSFSNWEGVDVRNWYSRKYLSIYMAYLDSKYRDNTDVLFLVLGNEIDLGHFFNQPIQKHRPLYGQFFKHFNSIISDLSFLSYPLTVASPFVDRSENQNLLMINALNTNVDFWTNDLSKAPKLKRVIAGEWGGFQAPNELPTDWLRGYRIEEQWKFINKYGMSGGFFFAAQDNPFQPSLESFNDPFSFQPDDTRGILDANGNPKESFWNLSYLYSPLKILKQGDSFRIINLGSERIDNISVNSIYPQATNLNPGESTPLKIQKLDFSSDWKVSYNIFNEKTPRTNILFHAKGRLTGCVIPIPLTIKASGFRINSLKRSDILVANFTDLKQLKISGGEFHFSGKMGEVEIHPLRGDISVLGATKISYLRPCYKSFILRDTEIL